MAIDTNKLKWAEALSNDSVTGVPNKVEPPTGIKNDGINRGEPISRQHLNYQFDQYYQAFADIQAQINALTLDAGIGLLQQIYDVGSIYISASSTDPATKFGFGTWTRIKGKMLVGLDEADTDFDGVGETGGSKSHSHNHTLAVAGHALTISEMPPHTHTVTFSTGENDGGSTGKDVRNAQSPSEFTATTSSTGSGQAHTHGLTGSISSSSNLPPYYTVYIWRRTA